MAQVGTAFIEVTPDLDNFGRSVSQQVDRDRGIFARAGSTIGSVMGSAIRAGVLGAGAAVGLGAILAKESIEAASSVEESTSRLRVVLGDAADEIEDFARGAARSIGLSRRETLEVTGQFANMAQQIGYTTEDAAAFSIEMTTLASDLASFHNADITQVLEAQAAAFRGEYDAVQRFVPTINAAAVEQQALAMGLANTTSELDAQDRALATQALLLQGAGAAMGDFARTQDSLANQQRTLNSLWDDAKVALGERLLPVATQVVTWLVDNFPAMEAAARSAFDYLGPAVVSTAGWFRDEFIPAVQTAYAWVKDNVIPVLADLGRTFRQDVVPALQDAYRWFQDNVVPALQAVWNEVSRNLAPAVDDLAAVFRNDLVPVAENAGRVFREDIEPALDGVFELLEGLAPVLGEIIGLMGDLAVVSFRGLVNYIDDVVRGFEATADAIRAIGRAIDDIPGVGGFGGAVQNAARRAGVSGSAGGGAFRSAHGNVFDRPALTWVGDYHGVRGNPEVVARSDQIVAAMEAYAARAGVDVGGGGDIHIHAPERDAESIRREFQRHLWLEGVAA